jgi:trans-aconitate methyltransferase
VFQEEKEIAGSVQRAVHFALPYWASLVVLGPDAGDVLAALERERREGCLLQGGRFSRHGDGGEDLVARLEELRGHGWDYVLVPAAAYEWLADQPRLKQHLERRYREVRSDDACSIIALAEPDADYPADADDGFPLPPPEMVGVVSGQTRPDTFYEGGAADAKRIMDVLEGSGVDLEALDAVLDFGCGCGRMIRHWRTVTSGRLHGSDYNPYLVGWCRENLPFGRFELNTLDPVLAYDDDTFDVVYAQSVFTHLSEPLQGAWIEALTRVTRPGGKLVVTVHGRSHLEWLDQDEARAFDSGQLVVRESELAGTAVCAVWHPERYVRETLADGLRVVDYSLGSVGAVQQDTVVLEKP